MKYKYILFDIDDTLIEFERSFKNGAAKVLEMGGAKITPDALTLFKKLNDDEWFGSGMDEIHNPYIHDNYHMLYHRYVDNSLMAAVREFNLQGNFDDLMKCFNRSLGTEAHINPNAVTVLEKLHKDHILCIATNGLIRIQPYKADNFKEYISKVFVSEAMNHMKPEKEYFDYIIHELGCKRNECLMVGDSLINDISGAMNSGIAACYYNPQRLENKTSVRPDYEINDFIELLDIV